jgi:hypothetical protein
MSKLIAIIRGLIKRDIVLSLRTDKITSSAQ